MTHTDVATANVRCSLRLDEARKALGAVLDLEPDLIGLQEWGLSRHRLLRETGIVRLVPQFGVRIRRGTAGREPAYLWASPIAGGCPVGARADRFELIECHSRILSWIARGDQAGRGLTILPPRIATVGVYRDRQRDRNVSLVNFHLTPGVQVSGRYREDRPRLVKRHQGEVRKLNRLIGELLMLGHVVYAMGDSNFDGLRLAGLTSAWEGRENEPGTLGPRRHVDDVYGAGRSDSVTLLTSDSDHKALIVSRAD